MMYSAVIGRAAQAQRLKLQQAWHVFGFMEFFIAFDDSLYEITSRFID